MTQEHCTPSNDPRLVGDPVDTLTGAVVDRTLEFRLTGPIELRWYRHYDSARRDQFMAHGWGHSHEFDRWLLDEGESIVYVQPLGQRTTFPRPAGVGDVVAMHGFSLERAADRGYLLHRHAEPSMGFEFRAAATHARLGALWQDDAVVRFEHDAALRLERILDSAGRVVEVEENPDGTLASLTLCEAGLPASLLITYVYDDRGRLVATRNGQGHGHAFAYDQEHRLLLRQGRMGFQFRYAYDAQGRCTASAGDGRMHGVALRYEVPGRRVRVQRPDGGSWLYDFDRQGLLSSIVAPDGGQQRFVRDELGRPVLEIDPNGNASQIEYDAAGAPVARISPLGHRVSLPEDPNAADPQWHRVAANAAEYEWGRILDLSQISRPTVDALSRLPIEPALHPLIETGPPGDPLGDQQDFEVGPIGVLWWPEPARGRRFNALGKLTEQVDERGHVRRWRYDAAGNLAAYTDFDGQTWTHDHGSWHLLQSETNPLGATVHFTYTTSSEVASFQDAGGTLSRYVYDQQDRLVEVWRDGRLRDRYRRDAAGNLIAKHAGDGRPLLDITIGAGNLPVMRRLASGDVHTLSYDRAGRPVQAATLADRIDLAYDDLGNRTLEKRNGQGIEQKFDAWRRPAQNTVLGRFVTRFEWDEMGSALTLVDPAGGRHGIRFLDHGIVERRMHNGSAETSQHDQLGRCLFKRTQRHTGQTWTRRYHWSGEGELRLVEDNLRGDVHHDYDAAHRLAARTLGGRTEQYVMDAADNLLAQPGLHGVALKSANRLERACGQRIDYNDREHIAVRSGPSGQVRYHYDSRDQLVACESAAGLWEAAYDPFQRRTRVRTAAGTTEYHWSDDQLIAEIGPGGTLRIYVYADPLALSPLLFIDYDSVDADPASGRRYVVFGDQVGAPLLIEDDAGATAWSAQIAPFGLADVAADSTIDYRLRLPGHYADAEIGLHYNRHRHYDPQLGRYLQSDPWGIPGGYNLYAYRTNPLLTVDARGLGEEEKKKGKPCPDEEGNKTGAALAKEAGLPKAPKGYHYVNVGGQPRIRANPGSNKPPLVYNSKTGKFQKKPPESKYRRATFDDDERKQVFDSGRGDDGKVRCPCGKPIKSHSSDDMQMGHKPGEEFAPSVDKAVANNTSTSDFNAQQKDLSKYRPEHPKCNQSHKFENKPPPENE